MQALKRQQANTHTHTHAHRLWRKPSPCKPTFLPMSRTDLGQSWLMCPQLPRGFWSGGSNAFAHWRCILMQNITEHSCNKSTFNCVIRITPRQCGWLRGHSRTQKWQSKHFALSLCQLLCQHYDCLLLLWFHGCIRPVSRSSGTQGNLYTNTEQPTQHELNNSSWHSAAKWWKGWDERHPCHCIYR